MFQFKKQILQSLPRFMVSLVLVAGLLILPWLYYSHAHLHVVNGAVVVHWHPDKGLGGENPDSKAPVAGHKHSFAELFNLCSSGHHPGILPDPGFLPTFVSDGISGLPFLISAVPEEGFPLFPSGRSPPIAVHT